MIAILAAATLAACAKQPTGSTPDLRPELPDGDAVVIRIGYQDGFVPAVYNASRLPTVSIYADGRVITEGPVPAIYPGPALPNIELREISVEDVSRLAGMAITAGVGKDQDFGEPGVMDAPSTVFVVNTADRTYRTSVNALGDYAGDNLTASQRQARKRLQDLVEAMTDLPRTLGAEAVSTSEQYKAITVAAFAQPYTPPNGIPTPSAMTWPGPDLPGEPFYGNQNLTCLTVTGDKAGAVLDAAAKANTAVAWTSAGEKWNVTFRPLLPDEVDCASLKGR